MSLLAIGLSHRSAPVAVLERTALSGDGLRKLLADLRDAPHVSEAIVLCTRRTRAVDMNKVPHQMCLDSATVYMRGRMNWYQY